MNQDNYMGEAYKMRNLLDCFHADVVLVGFPETIFSETHGAVALCRHRGVHLPDVPAVHDVAAHGSVPLRPPGRVG